MPKYLIVGRRSIDGVAPGGTVEIDAERGDALARAGHLKRQAPPAKKAPARKPETED